jgi:hypothetical protein
VQRNAEEQYNKEKNDGNTNQGGEYNSGACYALEPELQGT